MRWQRNSKMPSVVLADPERAAEKADQGSSEFELGRHTRLYLPQVPPTQSHSNFMVLSKPGTWTRGPGSLCTVYTQGDPRTSTAGVWQDHVTRCTSNCKNFKQLSQRKYLLTSHLIWNFHENLKTCNSCTLTLKPVLSVPGSFLEGIL